MRVSNALRLAVPALAALALAACGAEEEKTYEADVTDESGGEIIVTDVDPAAVDVELPETEMTNVPVEEATEEAPAE